MAYTVGQAEVIVVPNADRFNELLAPQINQAGKKAGEQVGKDFTDSVQETVKKSKPVRLPKPEVPKPDAPEMPAPDTRKSDAEIKKFLADFNARMKKEYQQSGNDSGNALATGLRLSFLRNSPLIAAAVGGGLIAGAPVAIAGAGVLFAGIAAVAEKNNVDLKAAATSAGAAIKETLADAASSTVPMFVGALGQIRTAVQGLEPQLAAAFGSLGGPIDSLTAGVIGLVQNAMPGLVSAVRNAGPVFAGLSSLLSEIGTGLGQFFQLVGEHGAQAGVVFQALGQAVGALLPILGELMGAGVQLGSAVLPPLADALSMVAKVVQVIGPALPAVVAGLGGLMIARALQGPLQTLAQNLAFASYQGGALGRTAGLASSAVSGLASGLPIAGFVLGTFMEVQQRATDQAKEWAQALLNGGTAAETASAQMSNFGVAMRTTNSGFEGFITGLVGFGAQAGVTADALSKVKDQQKQLTDSMSPLQQAQQAVTSAQNDYLSAVQKWGPSSGQAAGYAATLRDKEGDLQKQQGLLNDVTGTGTTVTDKLKTAMQLTADAAANAKSQIKLLADSLDALTGKTVTMGDAEAAVTDATIAATTAVQNKKGALVDATGALNLHTEAGSAAWQALVSLRDADNQLIGTMEQQGATVDQVTTRDGQLRDSFIKTAEKMGFSAGQAQNLANQIYGIPSERTTKINADVNAASQYLMNLQAQIDAMHGKNIQITVSAQGGLATYTTDQRNLLYSGTKATGGPISGPGTGTSDTAGLFALSNKEWVIKAASAQKYGPKAMASVNAGTAMIVPGLAGGGPVGSARINVNLNETQVDSVVASLQHQLAAAGNTSIPGNRAAVAAIVQAMAAARGWGSGAEWQALVNVINRESGFNPNAANPSSSARGLFQKMTSIYGPVESTVPGQTNWGFNYIGGRYGDPIGAWNHELRFGWYDQGGPVPPGPSLIYNGTGQDELIAPKQTFKQAMQAASGGGAPQHFTVYAQFGEETLEARAVRVVGDALDMVYNRQVGNPS